MKKKLLAVVLMMTLAAAFCLSGCGGGDSAASAEGGDTSAAEEAESPVMDGAAYGYGGDDPVEIAAYKYMCEEVTKNFDAADVSIPVVTIFAEDLTNPDDVLVYGSFEVYNYTIDGDTLKCVSGGEFPGVMHMSGDQETGYTVTSFDEVASGGDFDESAKALFGDYYEDFTTVYSDDAARAENRKITVSDYVNLNGLDINYFQDEGWDPVELYKK